jgi:hypothetical protein
MAITIDDTPEDYAPVYNKMEYLLSSTNTAQPSFSFVADIYINGSGTKAARLFPQLRPSDSKGVVDIHRVLEATLTSDLGDITSILGTNDTSNTLLNYVVKFGEQYGGTIYPDLTVDSTRYAINASLDKRDWINWDFTNDYDLRGTGSKFLTNSPSTLYTGINDYGWLYYATSLANITDFYVSTYDSSGSLIGNWEIDTPATSTIQYVASSPASLNLIDNTDLLAGVQPIITSSVDYYTIYARVVGIQRSEIKTFQIRESCKSEYKRLIFLNELGGFDAFNFYLTNNSTTSVEKKMMKVNPDNVSGTSLVYSLSDKEKVQYYTKTTETIQLTSDWLTEEEDSWLLELISSPEIYLQTDDGLEYIAKVVETSHKKRKHVSEKLFNLTINIEVGYDNYRQRG